MKKDNLDKKGILQKHILPNEKLISWRAIDNNVIFLHKQERSFYELNKTGSFIWRKANGKIPIKKLIDRLCNSYDIDRQTAEKDASEFINDLLKKKIFIVK